MWYKGTSPYHHPLFTWKAVDEEVILSRPSLRTPLWIACVGIGEQLHAPLQLQEHKQSDKAIIKSTFFTCGLLLSLFIFSPTLENMWKLCYHYYWCCLYLFPGLLLRFEFDALVSDRSYRYHYTHIGNDNSLRHKQVL